MALLLGKLHPCFKLSLGIVLHVTVFAVLRQCSQGRAEDAAVFDHFAFTALLVELIGKLGRIKHNYGLSILLNSHHSHIVPAVGKQAHMAVFRPVATRSRSNRSAT